jgi:hypothetical protein
MHFLYSSCMAGVGIGCDRIRHLGETCIINNNQAVTIYLYIQSYTFHSILFHTMFRKRRLRSPDLGRRLVNSNTRKRAVDGIGRRPRNATLASPVLTRLLHHCYSDTSIPLYTVDSGNNSILSIGLFQSHGIIEAKRREVN